MTGVHREGAEAAATHIATRLGAVGRRQQEEIVRIVETLGEERANALLAEVTRIEARGGRKTTDGTRRQTPTAVFFALARSGASPAEKARMFPRPSKNERARRKEAGEDIPAEPSAAT